MSTNQAMILSVKSQLTPQFFEHPKMSAEEELRENVE
jgi:hypothetical protein